MRLADKIFRLPSFQRQYESLLTLSVNETLQGLAWAISREELLSRIDWNNMLSIASILCYSEEMEHLDAALRICQQCLLQRETTTSQKNGAAVILETLANRQALQLAISRNLIATDYKEDLPLAVRLEVIKSNIENTIFINNQLLHVNQFQRAVFETHQENQSISISAPTSAGKSFILSQILLEEVSAKPITVVYLVPTRALISQVEADLNDLFARNVISGINPSTVPTGQPVSGQTNVYVFTQERLHWFLIQSNAIVVDLLIVDEAQKIDDSHRGILLQQKIEEVIARNSAVRIFFSSPFTSNPGILLEGFEGTKAIVDTQVVAVNQNLIYLSQVPRQVTKWNVTLCHKNENTALGTISLKERSGTGDFKKLCRLTQTIAGEMGGNLIYANGAAESEKIGLLLYSQLGEGKPSKRLAELIKLVKKTIHPKYALATVLEKGIAFHYGNIPLLIRQEIEALFRTGDIAYLICTSTLLEGVNLPAKSIFIRNPTRGKNKPMNENDFWNLAGRAGRLGKEMSGNIICFEPDTWKIKPNPRRRRQVIHKALDEIVTTRSAELVKYIKDGTPRREAETRQDLEFAFGYFYYRFLQHELDNTTPFNAELIEIFDELRKRIRIPAYILRRNPGISPIAQQALFDYFQEKAQRETLLPVFPEDADAQVHYTELIGRIGKTIADYPHQLHIARSILVINWMRGMSLSYLINSTYKFYQGKDKYKKTKTLPVVIREVMDAVENFVRFRFAKDSSCYIDILRYFLEVNQETELIEKIPDLTLWLEFGVNQKSHLSLLSLGLSRNTVIEISEYLPSSEMSREECLNWLQKAQLAVFQLSPIILADVDRIIQRPADWLP